MTHINIYSRKFNYVAFKMSASFPLQATVAPMLVPVPSPNSLPHPILHPNHHSCHLNFSICIL